ncbi:MAG: PleD family two-component system response regulator [Candidatus Hydrothermarchaeales archaeon]
MKKIMVVDDEEVMRSLMEKMLKGKGYEVVEASSGEECLEKLEEEKPDLILLDIMMPGMNGWEIGKIIKEDEKTTHILVAMFTVRTSDDSKEKSFRYSRADAHIDKPFDIEGLLGTIKGLMKDRRGD